MTEQQGSTQTALRFDLADARKQRDDLLEALKAASEHLDYCGYGDSWERECAVEAGLEKQIAAAIKRAGG